MKINQIERNGENGRGDKEENNLEERAGLLRQQYHHCACSVL